MCLVCAVSYSNGQTMTLDSIYLQIQQANPSLKMYDADIRSMDEAAKGARAWMPPEFGAGLWMTPYNPKYWKADDMDKGMGSFMVSGQQMLPNRRRQDAEASYMQAMSSVAKEKKQTSLNDLFAEAKKNYYDWIILEKKLNIINQNEKLLNFMIENAEIRYRNGLGKLSAYYKAKAALGNLQNMKLMMQGDIRQKRISLNTLMSRNDTIGFNIDTIYFIKEYTVTFDTSAFINQRTDLRAIDREIQLTYLQQNVERAKLKPEFGVKYDHMYAFGKQPWQFSLMGMVRIPIGGSTKMQKANIQSLRWRGEALNQQKQMILNEALGMAANMRNEIDTKRKQIKLYENNIIPALRNNYNTVQLAYEQNTEELFMLFDAWETLNMAQLEYLEQLRQLLIMQAELDRILQIK
jgi:outer membrane protein TolC